MKRRPTPRLTAKRRRKELMRGCLPYYLSRVSIAGKAAAHKVEALANAIEGVAAVVAERKLVPDDKVWKMKKPVCPICGGALYVHVEGWTQESTDPNSDWLADSVVVECENTPSLDSDEFDEFMDEHYRMPYVDWLPLEQSILRSLNTKYKFDLKEPSEVVPRKANTIR